VWFPVPLGVLVLWRWSHRAGKYPNPVSLEQDDKTTMQSEVEDLKA